MCFVHSQTLIQLCNQLAGCQAPDSQQTPSSTAIHSGHNPCSIWRLGFGVRQMRPLFGGITDRIEKIHQTRERCSARSLKVYTMAVKCTTSIYSECSEKQRVNWNIICGTQSCDKSNFNIFSTNSEVVTPDNPQTSFLRKIVSAIIHCKVSGYRFLWSQKMYHADFGFSLIFRPGATMRIIF